MTVLLRLPLLRDLAGALQGDIVLVVQQKDHDVFQRRGSDLIIKKEITLLEALTGPKFIVEHLDGHKVCHCADSSFFLFACSAPLWKRVPACL